MTKTFQLRAGILVTALIICGRAVATGNASTNTLVASAAAGRLPVLWSATSEVGQLKSLLLTLTLADDQEKDRDRDRDHDGDHDHDRDHHHHKDPNPGPAPVPEPASVLLFGAALLAGGTILRRRSRAARKQASMSGRRGDLQKHCG